MATIIIDWRQTVIRSKHGSQTAQPVVEKVFIKLLVHWIVKNISRINSRYHRGFGV